MKIIQPGKDQPSWLGQQVTCERCECVFELDADDKPQIVWRLIGMYTAGIIRCPECNLVNEFPATDNDLALYRRAHAGVEVPN
jgi:hypothetical protein